MTTCATCGGTQDGLEADRLPCLCELSPLETAPDLPEAAGGAGHAKALRCPSCGGWLEQGMRRCTYCTVELASVRCWCCFSLSFAGHSHCGRCGVRLGLEGDLGETESVCPACETTRLHRMKVGSHFIEECPDCGGVLVDHDTLEQLTHAREVESGLRIMGSPKRAKLTAGPIRYRPCAVCGDMMSRRNFGRRSGVIVDVCKTHGVFFDADELTHILEFVASGGLKAAREREADERRAALTRQRIAAVEDVHSATPSVGERASVHSAGALVRILGGFF